MHTIEEYSPVQKKKENTSCFLLHFPSFLGFLIPSSRILLKYCYPLAARPRSAPRNNASVEDAAVCTHLEGYHQESQCFQWILQKYVCLLSLSLFFNSFSLSLFCIVLIVSANSLLKSSVSSYKNYTFQNQHNCT